MWQTVTPSVDQTFWVVPVLQKQEFSRHFHAEVDLVPGGFVKHSERRDTDDAFALGEQLAELVMLGKGVEAGESRPWHHVSIEEIRR
ncbi:MAG TPA: hypothetical protein VGR71_02330 [Nitrospira sp.]|nr:hypothetical protein [Nitrospira sp.]